MPNPNGIEGDLAELILDKLFSLLRVNSGFPYPVLFNFWSNQHFQKLLEATWEKTILFFRKSNVIICRINQFTIIHFVIQFIITILSASSVLSDFRDSYYLSFKYVVNHITETNCIRSTIDFWKIQRIFVFFF